MAISVRFPDGSWRDVPSELRPIDPVTTGMKSRFRHVPVNCDPQWRYLRVASIWHARPRRGSLAILTPSVDDWWLGIAAMADTPASSDKESHSPRAA
ncbi:MULTISPECIES: hypothetical protein [Sphingomonas]|uniref:Uncharacterized protein n=1 Tax=Sphingomonas bisphenolicum TaxID=296544 RepID=A0ABN5W737_9SPHN|nr:hypothetical protein [Sphingomonas bisphenolicum]MBA4090300.1 hypothetical protein [Sphingobium sp.]BBF68061.1 hypothetical protein SBA_ch1_02610 [Sphingomonas bisphenolicum]